MKNGEARYTINMNTLRGGIVQAKLASRPAIKKKTVRQSASKVVIPLPKKLPAVKSKVPRKIITKKSKLPSTLAVVAKRKPIVKAEVVPQLPATSLKRTLSLISLFRFPVDTPRLMSQTARFSGLVFVFLGAVLALASIQQLLHNVDAVFYASAPTVFQTASLTDTISTNTVTSVTEPLTPIPSTSIRLSQQSPLHGLVMVEVITPNALAVEIYAYINHNDKNLGSAKQVANDKWVFEWDTTKYDNGPTYQIYARVRYTTDAEPNKTSVLPGVQLKNDLSDSTIEVTADQNTNTDVTAETTNVTAALASTSILTSPPPVEFKIPTTPSGTVRIDVSVKEAKEVWLLIHEETTGADKKITAKQNTTDLSKWLIVWDTTNFNDGAYSARVHVDYQDGRQFDSKSTAVMLTSETMNGEPVAVLPADTFNTTESDITAIEPKITLKLHADETLSGTENIEAELVGLNAEAVTLYLKSSVSTEPKFVGNMMKVSNSRFAINWYTQNTVNGSYSLFVRAKTASPTPIESLPVLIKVSNQFSTEKLAAKIEKEERYEDSVKTVTYEIAEAEEKMVAIVVPMYIPQTATSSQALRPAVPPTPLSTIFANYQSDIEANLLRLGTARRSGDETAEKRVMTQLEDLAKVMAKSATESTNYESILKDVKTQLNVRTTEYLENVDALDSLLVERNRSDVLQDSDKDGVSDFDEVVIYKTDPYETDTDTDGYTDGAEIISGFDPLDDTAESTVTYESPQDNGVFREDLLTVDNIEPIMSEEQVTATTTNQLAAVLTGKGLPNSFVTLYVFSAPVIVTVKTDADGAWRYRFDKELEDGEHNVYVGITDNAGRIVAKSKPLTFIKEAQALTPVQAASLETVVTTEDSSALLTGYIFYTIVSISVVAIGLVLIFLGLHIDSRRRRIDFLAEAA